MLAKLNVGLTLEDIISQDVDGYVCFWPRLCENVTSQKAVAYHYRFSFISDSDMGMHRVT